MVEAMLLARKKYEKDMSYQQNKLSEFYGEDEINISKLDNLLENISTIELNSENILDIERLVDETEYKMRSTMKRSHEETQEEDEYDEQQQQQQQKLKCQKRDESRSKLEDNGKICKKIRKGESDKIINEDNTSATIDNLKIVISQNDTPNFHNISILLNESEFMNRDKRDKFFENIESNDLFVQGSRINKLSIKDIFRFFACTANMNIDNIRYHLYTTLLNAGIIGYNVKQISDKMILQKIDLWYPYCNIEECGMKNIQFDKISDILSRDDLYMSIRLNMCRICVRNICKITKSGNIFNFTRLSNRDISENNDNNGVGNNDSGINNTSNSSNGNGGICDNSVSESEDIVTPLDESSLCCVKKQQRSRKNVIKKK